MTYFDLLDAPRAAKYADAFVKPFQTLHAKAAAKAEWAIRSPVVYIELLGADEWTQAFAACWMANPNQKLARPDIFEAYAPKTPRPEIPWFVLPQPLPGKDATVKAWAEVLRNIRPAGEPELHVPVTAQRETYEEESMSAIHFKPEEPRRLQDYGAQAPVVMRLSRALSILQPGNLLDHALLIGPPGFGKTLLAKLIAAEQEQKTPLQFMESYGANLDSVKYLDQLVWEIQTPTVWLIDEIHVISKEIATKLYLLMEEGRYPFAGSVNPTPLPPVQIIGATTDYGALHPALKRRFGEAYVLRPLNRGELVTLVHRLGYPLDPAGQDALIDLVVQDGAPHELKTLFDECVTWAKSEKQSQITEPVVRNVCHMLGIDKHGLRTMDRDVLRHLMDKPRKSASEADICFGAQIDRSEFQASIRPRLMRRGLIEVRPGVGIALTPKAFSLFTTE